MKNIFKTGGGFLVVYGVLTGLYYAGSLLLAKRNSDRYYKLVTNYDEEEES